MLRFTSDSGMDKELVRYDRNFVREGVLTKARLQRRQKRHCFLFNDLLLYAVHALLLTRAILTRAILALAMLTMAGARLMHAPYLPRAR